MKRKPLLLLTGLGLTLATGCVTRTYTVSPPPPARPAITLAEVQSLVQAHVSDAIIVSQIQNSSTQFHLTADQIITLKNAGASDGVLTALINSATNQPPAPASSPQVVHETYVAPYPSVYVDPWPWWGWGPYYGGYYHGYYHGRGWR